MQHVSGKLTNKSATETSGIVSSKWAEFYILILGMILDVKDGLFLFCLFWTAWMALDGADYMRNVTVGI